MQFDQLKRREFITLLCGAAAWPVAARAQQNNGRGRAVQERGFLLGQATVTAHHVFIPRHEREGFVATLLADAQPGNRLRVSRIACEVEPSNSLDRHDLSGL